MKKFFSSVLAAVMIVAVFATSAFAAEAESKVVTKSVNYGQTSPASTLAYDEGGFSGILTLQSVVDNGSYVVYTYPTTTTQVFNRTIVTVDVGGPGSYSINENGYVGEIPKVSVSYYTQPDGHRRITTTYSGTLAKQVITEETRWVTNWTAVYSGTVVKPAT